MRHPQSSLLLDTSTPLYTFSSNGPEYLRLCYARWLAYADSAATWADFDVINYGIGPDELLSLGIEDLPIFLSYAGACGTATPTGYAKIIDAFVDYARSSTFALSRIEQLLSTNQDVNDMTLINQFYPSFYPIPYLDHRIAVDFGRDDRWQNAKLVHYDHGKTELPRSITIERVRPFPVETLALVKSKSCSHSLPLIEPSSSAERLSVLAKLNQATTYLEIGVQQGLTFHDSLLDFIHQKIAVDPQFMFDIPVDHEEGSREYHQCLSDRYFASVHPDERVLDLIYLDGLHTFDQTYRDFCNTLCFARRTTIWLIDDVLPLSLAQAEPDLLRCAELKKAIGEEHGWWMGDVYKVVAAIHDYYPCLSFGLLRDDDGPGQLVVWFERRKDFLPMFKSLGEISNLSYQDFLILLSQGVLYQPSSWTTIVDSIKACLLASA